MTAARLSIRGYAKHRGVDEKAVRKALAAGRITKGADGRIDRSGPRTPTRHARRRSPASHPARRHNAPRPSPPTLQPQLTLPARASRTKS
jgi:pyruvate/2-oxoglutarate dehydrogenase complex dihydrolipoamide acyltransferase (E2) component